MTFGRFLSQNNTKHTKGMLMEDSYELKKQESLRFNHSVYFSLYITRLMISYRITRGHYPRINTQGVKHKLSVTTSKIL